MYDDVILPTYATDGSVGFDIHAYSYFMLRSGETAMVTTGLRVQIPKNTELTVRQRSGISKTFPNYIAIGIGTIDFDYRGQILIPVVNNANMDFIISKGMRIAQCVLSPIIQPTIQFTDKLDDTERGQSGFGSTGA